MTSRNTLKAKILTSVMLTDPVRTAQETHCISLLHKPVS